MPLIFMFFYLKSPVVFRVFLLTNDTVPVNNIERLILNKFGKGMP